MDFELSQDQRLLEETLANFAQNEFGAAELRNAAYSDDPFPGSLWKRAVDIGLPSLLVPEDLGGAGLHLLEATIAMEQAGVAALPLPLLGQFVASAALVEFGTEVQQGRWLPGLIDGSAIGAVGFTRRTGRETGDEIRCPWVPFAAQADLFVLAEDDSVGLVDMRSGDVSLARVNAADLTGHYFHLEVRRSSVTWLSKGRGARLLDAARVLLAADAWGVAKRMLEAARTHALDREQFGRRIGEFQSVKHPIADMTVIHEFSRALVWDAANAWDSRVERAREAAMLCKAHLGQQAVEISRRCIELMGATGFAWEEDHHLWLKRAQMDGTLLGASMELRALLAESRGWHVDVSKRDERSELHVQSTES